MGELVKRSCPVKAPGIGGKRKQTSPGSFGSSMDTDGHIYDEVESDMTLKSIDARMIPMQKVGRKAIAESIKDTEDDVYEDAYGTVKPSDVGRKEKKGGGGRERVIQPVWVMVTILVIMAILVTFAITLLVCGIRLAHKLNQLDERLEKLRAAWANEMDENGQTTVTLPGAFNWSILVASKSTGRTGKTNPPSRKITKRTQRPWNTSSSSRKTTRSTPRPRWPPLQYNCPFLDSFCKPTMPRKKCCESCLNYYLHHCPDCKSYQHLTNHPDCANFG